MADKLSGAQGDADASQVDAAAAENQSACCDLVRKLDEDMKELGKDREVLLCNYQQMLARICATFLERQEVMANQLLLMYKLIRELIIPGAVAAGAGGSRGAGLAEQEAGGGSNSPATITRICATLVEREETMANHLSLVYKLIQELIPGRGVPCPCAFFAIDKRRRERLP